MLVLVPLFILMLVASMSIPAEQAISNQTKVVRNLYLSHVSEDMDQFHFYAEDHDPSSKTYGTRVFMQFCPTNSLIPPWNEGQTITWMKVQVEPDCLRLLGYDGLRDSNPRIINN